MKRYLGLIIACVLLIVGSTTASATGISTYTDVTTSEIYAEILSGLGLSYWTIISAPKYRVSTFVAVAFDLMDLDDIELKDALEIIMAPSWTGAKASSQEVVYYSGNTSRTAIVKIKYNVKSGYAEYTRWNYKKELSEKDYEQNIKSLIADDGISEYYQNPESEVIKVLEGMGITVTKNK